MPRLAVKPASGRMTSLGRGGNRFSNAMAKPAPGAPMVSIRSTAHCATPERLFVGSDVWAGRSAEILFVILP
ncbi:hypothetical protein GCM10027402_23510 [Arthrobacter monumenti]